MNKCQMCEVEDAMSENSKYCERCGIKILHIWDTAYNLGLEYGKEHGSTIAPRSNSPSASQSEDLIAGKEQSADCPNLSADKLSLPADINKRKMYLRR